MSVITKEQADEMKSLVTDLSGALFGTVYDGIVEGHITRAKYIDLMERSTFDAIDKQLAAS